MKFLLLLLVLFPLCAEADIESDFRIAREAFSRGNAARLDQVAEKLKDTALEPYVTYYQLRLHWNARDTTPIHAFLARTDESPVVDQFRGDWLKYLGKQQRWDEFAEEYPRFSAVDNEVICYFLQMRQRSDAAFALGAVRIIWFRAEEMPENCTSLIEQALQQGIVSEDDIWQRMRLALEGGNVTFAKRLIRLLSKAQQFPASELSSAAANPRRYLDRVALANAGMGKRLASLFALQRLARQSPQVALARWERIAKFFPEKEQRYFFGWLGFAGALNHDARSLAWFAAAGDEELNPKQLAWRTRAALRVQNWHEVWESINAMLPQQQEEGAWRYWKARSLAALGRPADADDLFLQLGREYNYYGQLAAEELGAGPGANMITSNFRPDDGEIEAILSRTAMQRTLLLYNMDFRTEAAKEWAWATRNFSDRQLLVAAEAARRSGMYDRSINAADRTVSQHDFTLRYPAPYREVLQENLNKHGLEEAWVYGLMRQESRFTSKALSGAGAAGLMQIMPATARWAANRMGMKGYRKGLIHQLDVNIKLGTYYMKTVFNQFGENPVLASAAYNAGPERARQWRGSKPLEGAIYIETIPFDETRDYVQKVMSNTIYYSRLFGQLTQSLKQRLGVIEAKEEKTGKVLHD